MNYYEEIEEPEISDEELFEIWLDGAMQDAPPTDWTTCYCEADNRCRPCTEARDAANAPLPRRVPQPQPSYACIGNGLYVRTRRSA